ncbi:hypothetical protein MRX96_039764 [Rhipicephalus microplus]
MRPIVFPLGTNSESRARAQPQVRLLASVRERGVEQGKGAGQSRFFPESAHSVPFASPALGDRARAYGARSPWSASILFAMGPRRSIGLLAHANRDPVAEAKKYARCAHACEGSKRSALSHRPIN